MYQIRKVAGYRKMLGKTQMEMAKIFGITRQGYYLKESGQISFTDEEKIQFKNLLIPIFPNITIDEIFF